MYQSDQQHEVTSQRFRLTASLVSSVIRAGRISTDFVRYSDLKSYLKGTDELWQTMSWESEKYAEAIHRNHSWRLPCSFFGRRLLQPTRRPEAAFDERRCSATCFPSYMQPSLDRTYMSVIHDSMMVVCRSVPMKIDHLRHNVRLGKHDIGQAEWAKNCSHRRLSNTDSCCQKLFNGFHEPLARVN